MLRSAGSLSCQCFRGYPGLLLQAPRVAAALGSWPSRTAQTMAASAIPTVQRAAIVTGYGGPARLAELLTFVTDKPVPQLGAGQVLVRIKARPVNPADGLAAMGFYPGFAPASVLPATLGLEGAGEVAAAAPDVANLQVGQRVVPLLGYENTLKGEGSWQEYVAVKAEHVVPIPDDIPDGVAAQLVINPVTVVGILRELAIPPGEYLLQTQAGGAVGRQMITLAKAKGIKTINVVRRRETVEELKALGADEVISSADEDVTARVLEITGGKGAYGALESVAGELTGKVVSAVRRGGTVLLFGGASGPTFTGSIGDFIFQDKTLKGFWVHQFLGAITDAAVREDLFKEVIGFIQSGIIKPTVEKAYDLSEFAAALKDQQAPGRQGKLILVG